MTSKKNSSLFSLVAVLTLFTLDVNAADTFRVENDFYLQHNDISGPSASSSMLTNGLTYYNLISIYTKGRFEGFDYNINAGLKLTDDERKDIKKLSLFTLSGQIKGNNQVLDLGDFFRSYSKYSLNTSLKGAGYTYTLDNGDTLDVTYGLAIPRWDSFWSNEVESTDREVYGIRYNKKVTDKLEIGFDAVKTHDSNGVVANIPLYDTSLVTINSTYRPIPGLKLYGEFSHSQNETDDGTTNEKNKGNALFLQAIGNKNPSRVQLEFERIDPDFKTVTGSATPDREKAKATWRYKITPKTTMNTGFLWFRDNLDGDKTETTHTYRPNIGFTFKDVFERQYAVVDINYKLNMIDRANKTSDDMFDLNYRDRFGIVYSDIGLAYTLYDTSNGERSQKEFRFNSTFNTRHTLDDLVLKPSIMLGTWDMNDELDINGNNQYYQAAVGLGFDIPSKKITTNLRVGKNKSTRDTGDDLDKMFGSFDLYWNLGKMEPFSRVMVYAKAYINDLQYSTASNDYQEQSVTLGVKMSF
jgi:hypothetical protein